MQPVNQIYHCMWFAGQACNLQPIDSIFALNKTTNGKFVIENLKNPTKIGIFIDESSKVLFDQNRHSPPRLPQTLRVIFVWILAEMLL